MKRITFIFLFLSLITFFFPQESLKSLEEEYYDFLCLKGLVEKPVLNYRTLSDSVWNFAATAEEGSEENEEGTKHVWQNNNLGTTYTYWKAQDQNKNWFTKGIEESLKVRYYGPEFFMSVNTNSPYGQNDGALWQGKGFNTSMTAGARLEAFGFEVTLKPQLSFSQNSDFDILTPNSHNGEYGYIQEGLDLPQRFGDSSFWNFDWGDTEIRWSWHTFTVGFGFQNPWLGPMWLNPMLGSNNAPSYPKVDFGLRKTSVIIPKLGWYLGDIEGRIFCGYLSESDYFDDDSSNNRRMLTGMTVALSPAFIPGFSFGLNRIFITHWDLYEARYIKRLFDSEKKNDWKDDPLSGEDQKVSLFADWRFPKIGFQVYGELGLDDFTSNEETNPFHTGVYSVGAKQVIPLPLEKLWSKLPHLETQLILEWNNFEMSQDFQLQWEYTGYYSHCGQAVISHGYTQKGQLLGAGTGYSGNSQFIGWKFFFPKGYFMPFFHRSCPDNNYILNKAVRADASSHSNSGKTEFDNYYCRDYYAAYKTYLEFGFNADVYILPRLNFQAGFSAIKICRPEYNNYSDSTMNYYITTQLKFIF